MAEDFLVYAYLLLGAVQTGLLFQNSRRLGNVKGQLDATASRVNRLQARLSKVVDDRG